MSSLTEQKTNMLSKLLKLDSRKSKGDSWQETLLHVSR